MKYKKGSTFPYTEANLRTDNPLVSFPKNALADASVRTDYGVVEVQEAAIPSQPGYKVVAGDPAGDPLTEVWNLVVKDVSEVTGEDITDVDSAEGPGQTPEDGVPEFVAGDPYGYWKQTWTYTDHTGVVARRIDYGSAESQIEYITENGLAAWQTKVAEIKAKYPK